ncbi:translation initiation factor IF-2-like [Corvus cornix cornix]|uniref:translation initiation factor IF-2-like n=1 Tax=Corvus cornix cornix TaxID=932674 RepID=UPI0019508D51|nr:translation initiation factor IF-2-like [Corvus cornix cornix]
MKKNLSRLKSPGNCYCWGKTKHFLQTRKCVLMFRHLLTTNKAGSGVRRGARVAALTRCSHRFTALRGSVLWTERPRHRPLSSRPSSGPALPAPPLRAGQMNRWGPDGPRQPSAPGPAGRAGHQQAGAFGAAGGRAALPAARERLWGAAARLGPGGEPRWSVRSWGVSPGPCSPRGHGRPAGAPRRRRPAPGGENAAARGRYRPHPLPEEPALPSVPGHSLPSFPAPQRHPSKCGKYFGFSRRRTKKQQLSLRLDQMNTDLTSLFKNPTAHARKRYCASVKYKVLSITIIAAIMI